MADVRIDYQLNGREALAVDLHSEADHPDALDDLTRRVLACFHAALVDVYAVTSDTDR